MITLKSKYKIKNNYKDIKLFILLISLLIIKILLIFFIGEDDNALLSESENEWGKLFISLKNHGYMSWFSTNEILFRNAFMPPLYVYFIYIISFISEVHLVKITLIIQIFLSLLTSFIFFKLCIKKRFSNNQAITACIIFSYYPLHLYGTAQISSATIVLFIYTLFIYLIVANKNIFFISLVASAGILARGEFKFIYIIFIFYYILKNKVSIKKAFLSFLLTIAIIFPQLLNNYIYFEKIFITHSSGYVLWRGNNELSNVTSIDADKIIGNMEKSMLRSNKTNNDELTLESPEQFKKIIKELSLIKNDLRYDVLRDDVFKKYAIQNILDNPLRYINLCFKKFLSYVFFNINSEYPNYYHPFSIIPEIILSIGAIIGIFISTKKFRLYLSLYIFIFFIISIYSLLLILPRYKLFLLPCYTIFFSIFIFEAKSYLKKLFI